MARMPGAVWVPKPIPGRAYRRKGRGVIFHIAVTEASSLYPGPNADWHFYVNKVGTIYQYIDTDFQAWAAGEANATCIMVETQGGVYNPEGEKLTAAQVEGWAKIAAFAHESEGVPLQLMRNSLSTERGLGWHKLGCDPWRVPGGQRWSSAYGKICPGLAKIAQMPEVLARAKAIVNPEPAPVTPQEDVDMILIRNEKGSVFLLGDNFAEWVPTAQDHRALMAKLGGHVQLTDDMFDRLVRGAREATRATVAIEKDLADE